MTSSNGVTSIPSLDLGRYLGKWYEICRLPIRHEDETATDITARYSLNPDGTVRVDNRCFDGDGKPMQALGQATPVDESRARLKVSFLPQALRWIPFTSGDYWVLRIDPDYRVALVGSPDRRYLWLLAREPEVETGLREEFLASARSQGFATDRLIVPRHTGRDVTDEMVRGQ